MAMFDPASYDPGPPDPERPPVRISVNWRALAFLLGAFAIAVVTARTWSVTAGAALFVGALVAMGIAALRSSNRGLDSGIASGFEPQPHTEGDWDATARERS
jgi:hypothetical protein